MTDLTTLDLIIRLLIVAVLSAVIGYEREHRNKPAGLRTNILVGLGTAVVTIASVKMVEFGGKDATDVSRLMSSILPGIGFIGAGTIIRAGKSVKGLTTAASIWVVASIGIVCGLGYYVLALVATVLAFITLAMLPAPHDDESEK